MSDEQEIQSFNAKMRTFDGTFKHIESMNTLSKEHRLTLALLEQMAIEASLQDDYVAMSNVRRLIFRYCDEAGLEYIPF